MNIIDLATKTMQTAIKTVVDNIKVTTDTTKTKVDTVDARTASMKTIVDAINANVGTLINGKVVKSVQRGSKILYSSMGTVGANITDFVTISPVDTNKSLVSANFNLPQGGITGGLYNLSCNMTNSNTLQLKTFHYSNNGGLPLEVQWQVIEFY